MRLTAWHSMLEGLGVPAEEACFRSLVDAYEQPHRHYHTTRHIADCLVLLAEHRDLAVNIAEVECSLWFHDAIYEPMRSDNEERSAEWAAEFLRGEGASADAVDRIRKHILATRHSVLPSDRDAQLVVDIDLSILGATEERYEEFETQVRREYRWVPGPLYRRKRVEVLRSFADRAAIYFHDALRARFESRARTNLQRAIDRLSGAK